MTENPFEVIFKKVFQKVCNYIQDLLIKNLPNRNDLEGFICDPPGVLTQAVYVFYNQFFI